MNKTLEIMLDAQNNASPAIKKLSNDVNKLQGSMRKATKQVKQTQTAFQKFGQEIKNQSKNLLKYFLIYRTGTAALFAFTSAVTQGAEEAKRFGTAIGEINTIADLSAGKMTQVRESLEQLSVTMGIDATEAAKGFYQIVSAGVRDPDSAMTLLTTAAKTAKVGVTDLTTVIDLLAPVMLANNIPFEQFESVASKLFAGVKFGRMTMEELAGSFDKTVQSTRNLGLNFTDALGAMVAITQTGASASRAATQVQRLFLSFLAPNTKFLKVINEINKAYGINAKSGKDLIKQFGSFPAALQVVVSASKDLGVSMKQVIGRVEGFNAASAISGDKLAAFEEAIHNVASSGNILDAAMAQMANTQEFRSKKIAASYGLFTRRMGFFFTEMVNAFHNQVIAFGKIVGDKGLLNILMAFASTVQVFILNPLKLVNTVISSITLALNQVVSMLSFVGKALYNIIEATMGFKDRKAAGADIKAGFNQMKTELDTAFGNFQQELIATYGGPKNPFIADFSNLTMQNLVNGLKDGTAKAAKTTDVKDLLKKLLGDLGGGKGGSSRDQILKTMERLGTAMRRRLERSLVMDKELGPNFAAQVNAIIRGSATAVGQAKDDLTPAGLENLKERLFELTTAFMRLRKDHRENMKDTKTTVEEVNTHFQDMASAVSDLTSGFGSINDALFQMELISDRTRDKLSAVLSVAVTAAQTIAKIVSLQEAQKGAFQIGSAAFSGGASIVGTLLSAFMHSGGPIQRLHRGGAPNSLASDEVPIIAQTGEFMFSRRAVNNLGGQEAVSRMHQQAEAGKGASSPNVNLNLSFDPDNFRSFLSDTAQGRDIVKQAVIQAFPT